MKAIRVHQPGGPEVLKLEEVPDPKPGAGQVLIAVHAVGVNPVETYIRSGNYGWKVWPYTAGTVTGAYAQKTVAPEARVFKLPEKISFQQGAALGVPYGTAHRALFHR